MNWIKLKEKFPKSYQEIREFSKNTGYSGRKCLNEFLKLKGFKIGLTFIYNLREYESKRQNN